MSAPHEYGQPGVQPQYDGQPYDNPAGSPPPQAVQQHAEAGGKKKKRAYAAGAFDVGTGGNAAVGGQLPGGGQFGTPQPMTPAYGGYPGQDQQAAAAAYPGAQQFTPVAGPGYPQPGYGAAPMPGVADITQGMSNMQMGGGQPVPQQQQQQQPPQARIGPLNQLYPTDLLSQPFNVSELDLPPPPVILPPNVSLQRFQNFSMHFSSMANPNKSPAVLPPRKRTALQNMCDPHLTLFPRRTPSSRSRSCPLRSLSSHTPRFMIWMTQSLSSRTRSFPGVDGAGPT